MGFVNKFLKVSLIAVVCPALLIGAQQPNPRSNTRNVVRNRDSESSAMVRRSATSVIARSVSKNARQTRTVTARPSGETVVKARSARSNVITPSKSRSATKPSLARSSTSVKNSTPNKSRAGTARATAVFNDITKIGGGYTECRDAYATCMDQFCANANDTYRRCFCSDRFTNFRETSEKLDEALKLLADFQDNNLNAVDKTAAEVNAMYTATAGEKAIKKDTSASQKLLDSIGDVLSGKSTMKKQNSTSLGILDISGFGDSGDIWGGDTESLFGGGDSANLSELEGKALYDKVNKQCVEITRESCGSDAMFNLARSAYSIMITQDCNMYEKNINTKKSNVEETVRTAEKYLRDARLEEYRSHNSADVNECLSKVESALRQPTACGANYEKCMDYTGLYINSTTGEPIYSQALFGLNNLIVLNGSADVLGANPNFNKILDEKRMFATTALNSCRDLADTVWYEFKRSAIIQIAQAQDEKIQQIKDSCVETIKECYDTQSGALNEIDTTNSQSVGAIAAVAARGMCYDRVQACAALYGDPDGCKYDDKTKTLKPSGKGKCGLQSLLTFVDTVDSVKVAEGCEAVLTKYAHELCDPKVGSDESVVYPMGCATTPKAQLRAAMEARRKTFCATDLVADDASNTLQQNDAFNTNIMNQIIKEIYDELGIAFSVGCEDDNELKEKGTWVSADQISNPQPSMLNQEFYRKYYGTTITNSNQINDLNLPETGWCILQSGKEQCENQGGTYTESGDCTLPQSWYSDRCSAIGGTMEGDMCAVRYGANDDSNSSRSQPNSASNQNTDTPSALSQSPNSIGNGGGSGNSTGTISASIQSVHTPSTITITTPLLRGSGGGNGGNSGGSTGSTSGSGSSTGISVSGLRLNL